MVISLFSKSRDPAILVKPPIGNNGLHCSAGKTLVRDPPQTEGITEYEHEGIISVQLLLSEILWYILG